LTEKVKTDASKFAYPLLMCLGSMDFIQPPEEAENFVENTSTRDREVAMFENGYHQLYNDTKA
jgi:esterase/lipase